MTDRCEPVCGSGGRCVPTGTGSTTSGVCECKPGWGGSSCDECAEGYWGAECQGAPPAIFVVIETDVSLHRRLYTMR
jgi:hypothetical protein